MASSGTIEHSGIISDVSDKLITVSIMPESACGNCRVRGLCSVGDKDEKTIEVFNQHGQIFSVGEQITVVLELSLGMKALGIGYVLPFFIVLSILIILLSAGLSEGFAGLLSLLSLAPYYYGLSFLKNKLKKEFTFRLKKCNNA